MKKRKTREEKIREITEKAEKLIRKKADDKFKWEVFRDDTHRFEMVRDE